MSDTLHLTGQVIDGYHITRYLGNGASGVVYEATMETNVVAIKVYKDWLFEKDPGGQDSRIQREASIGKITHRNVCRIFAHGRASILGLERRYLIMERVEGDSLEEFIKKGGPLDRKVFNDLALQILEGVKVLHQNGHIHRDIKPANVMIEKSSNRAVVMDFGVIADLDAATLTQGHDYLGTIAYSAPEWLRRDLPGAAESPAIDVYSLGATFYEMIIGKRLFDGIENRAQLMEAVAKDVPPSIRVHGFSRVVSQSVRTMLAKKPNMRPSLQATLDLLKAVTSESTSEKNDVKDPLEPVRNAIRIREDIRQRQEHLDARIRLLDAWRHARDQIMQRWHPLMAEGRTGGNPLFELGIKVIAEGLNIGNVQYWNNWKQLVEAYPDRDWEYGIGASFHSPIQGIVGVQVCYFVHGGPERVSIIGFVAQHPPNGEIDLGSVHVWEGALQEAVLEAVQGIPGMNTLVHKLFSKLNA